MLRLEAIELFNTANFGPIFNITQRPRMVKTVGQDLTDLAGGNNLAIFFALRNSFVNVVNLSIWLSIIYNEKSNFQEGKK